MSENTAPVETPVVEAPVDNGVNLANLPVEVVAEGEESVVSGDANEGTLTVSGVAGPAVNLAALPVEGEDEEAVEEAQVEPERVPDARILPA